MNLYTTSDGRRINQRQINNRRKWFYDKDRANVPGLCAGCGQRPPVDHDHTISQAKCKQLHKTELIFDPKNWVYSCRDCHRQWEAYKSGQWLQHDNAAARLLYLKEHDPQAYNSRINWDYKD